MYYLYLKTHNLTGLKYLGQTRRNPFTYKGSGKVWKQHLVEYGNDVTTEVLETADDAVTLKRLGLHYSQLWSVVETDEFANLKKEYGIGGFDTCCYTEQARANMSKAARGRKPSPETRKKMSEARSGKTRGPCSDELKRRISESKRGHKRGAMTQEHKDKISMALQGKRKTAEHIAKIVETRWGSALS